MRATVVLATVALSGCALITGEGEINSQRTEPLYPTNNVQPEFGDYSPWVGKHRDELVAELGHPDSTYQARHTFAEFDSGIVAITYVYSTGAGYVDAYVIEYDTGIIIKYHRR